MFISYLTILTSFQVFNNELLIFARGATTLSAKVNGVFSPLTLEKDETNPFHVLSKLLVE